MDPVATLEIILVELQSDKPDRELLGQALRDLAEWVEERGGFMPDLWTALDHARTRLA